MQAEMKPWRKRYLIAFVLAMFFLSNVAAAGRMCVQDTGRPDHVVALDEDACCHEQAEEETLPPAPCCDYLIESRQDPVLDFSSVAGVAEFSPSPFAFLVRARSDPAVRPVSPGHRRAVTPLTILLKNFRI